MVLVLLGLVAQPVAAQPPRVLRHNFAIGDRLIYAARHQISPLDEPTKPLSQHIGEVEIWCLARAGEERLMLLVQTWRTPDEPPQIDGLLVYLRPDGRRRWPDEIPARLAPLEAALELLPVLPVGTQREDAWLTAPNVFNERRQYTNHGPDRGHQGHLHIDHQTVDETGGFVLLGIEQRGNLWFGPRSRKISELTLVRDNRTRNTRTIVSFRLREHLRQSAAWCVERDNEAEHYLRTLRSDCRLRQKALERSAKPAKIRAELDALWHGFRSDVNTRDVSPFVTLADGQRRKARQAGASLHAHARLARDWLHRAAKTWTLLDEKGQTVLAEDVRQGVTIECFWTSATLAGYRTLDSLGRTQAEIPPRFRVQVVSYNMDASPARARSAIRDAGEGLRHVLAEPLALTEKLPALPVVRVLDQQGVVQGIWIGWEREFAAARKLAIELAARELP